MNINPFITIILLFSIFCSHAQNEAAIWYFGNNAGIDFNSGAPVAVNDGQLTTSEGCATISNTDGELLFYTDGITVWDKTHNIMQNGTGLLGNPSSTQSGIIVPKPGDSNIYYIFTVDAVSGMQGLNYSEVDLTLNSGNGAITATKNVQLTTPATEKISAISHANGTDFWVVAHGWENADFLAYEITSTGVNNLPAVSTVGSTHGGDISNTIGYLKMSPNGQRLALAVTYSQSFYSDTGAYGIEFSPNSEILYVTDLNFVESKSKIHQFDISLNTSADVLNSDTIIFDDNFFTGALQLAIDQKIYVSISGNNFLGAIENPDVLGTGASYLNNAVSLG